MSSRGRLSTEVQVAFFLLNLIGLNIQHSLTQPLDENDNNVNATVQQVRTQTVYGKHPEEIGMFQNQKL